MKRIVQLAAGLLIAAPALANDSVASVAAGGLVLQRTDAIDMVSEDLFVSAKEIRVRYVFRNRTPADVETIVAFPLPDRDLGAESVEPEDFLHPSDFRTKVDGKPADVHVERKAMLKGRDYTALLNQLHVPIAPVPVAKDAYDERDNITPALNRLSAAQKRKLKSLGLIDGLTPLWTAKQTWWWTQRFPAGRDLIVEHRYAPAVGQSNGTDFGSEYPNGPEARAEIARYCVDKDFLATFRRRQLMPAVYLDYILTTGANWRSPIGSFRLVVDKYKPGNLVSFCESDVKKISPTQYEVRHNNWRPTHDLHVLMLGPQPIISRP